MNTFKLFVVTIVTLLSTACGATSGWNTNFTNEATTAKIRHQACVDAGNCTEKDERAYAQAMGGSNPPLGTRPVITRPMPQQSVPTMMPGIMPVTGGGYVTSPPSVYGLSGSNDNVSYGVAVLDSSTSDCQGQCVKFYISAASMPILARKSNSMSLFIDGQVVSMNYYGNRAPWSWGDFRLANGKIVSAPISVVPSIRNWVENIRVHLKDPGEHNAKICFYYDGAKEMTGPNGVMVNTPYSFLMGCKEFMVSIMRQSSYAIQYGSSVDVAIQ